jgi:hypothetical protein
LEAVPGAKTDTPLPSMEGANPLHPPAWAAEATTCNCLYEPYNDPLLMEPVRGLGEVAAPA